MSTQAWTSERIILWLLFFATSVYGHVALKLAVSTRAPNAGTGELLRGALHPWGLSAFVAWTASGVLWMLVLSKQPLLGASSVSALRYALICGSAIVILGEKASALQLAGSALIVTGIALVAR
jgi:drug/metabolite transporter (DMT)-like permease